MQSPKTIRDQAYKYFSQEFNNIPLSLLEKAYPEFYEFIQYPKETDLDRHEIYPMWGTVFEVDDNGFSDWIIKHIDELAEIGVYVMDGFDELNACLFIAGCGYDFYEAHWIPLFKLYGWIKEEENEMSDLQKESS